MTDKIVLFSTCGSHQEAGALARALVEKRLAACVNIVPAVRSIYRWQGKVVDEEEFLLIIKSRRDLLQQLQAQLRNLHSYQVPEVIALQIVEGSPEYIKWLDRELVPPAPDD